jgi:hypothetical protein
MQQQSTRSCWCSFSSLVPRCCCFSLTYAFLLRQTGAVVHLADALLTAALLEEQTRRARVRHDVAPD